MLQYKFKENASQIRTSLEELFRIDLWKDLGVEDEGKGSSSDRKMLMIALLIEFLQKYLDTVTDDVELRTKLIVLIDQLNLHRELLEVETGKLFLKDIEQAASRFGRKAQSSFEE